MTIKIDSRVLAKELIFCNTAISRKPVTGIYGCFFMSIKSGVLTMYGTNMDVTNKSVVECESDSDVDFCVEASLFMPVVRNFIGDVFLKLEGNTLVVYNESSEYKLQTLDSVDFFKPSITLGDGFSMPSTALHNAISAASVSVEEQEIQTNIDGVYMNSVSNEVVGTDKSSMTIVSLDGIMKNIYITKSHIHAISLLSGSKDINIIDCGNYIVLTCGDRSISIIKREVNFPNYSQIIPTTYSQTFSVPTKELASKVSKLQSVSVMGAFIIDMEVLDGTLTLKSETLDFSISGVETISIEGEASFSRKINAKMLINLLNCRECDILHISISDNSPAIVLDGDDKIKTLLMPIV